MIRHSQLREREAIDLSDGSRLGYVSDLEIDIDAGYLTGLYFDVGRRRFGIFGSREQRLIPWTEVRKLGRQVILVGALPPKGSIDAR